MLVSGGKVIAIDSVKINKNDLKGDGVFEEIELSNARKEEINSIKNTANDAQSKVNSLTNRVNTIDNEVSTVKSDVETLKTNVNTVSAKTNANTDSINSIEADITNNIKPKIEQNTNNINTVSTNLTDLSGKSVTNIYGNNLSAYVEVADDGTRKYRIDVAPQISDTIINGKNGISAKKEGTSTWNIGISANYLSANALNNLSGNWQNTYSAVSSNSATWNKVTDKVDTTAFTPVKNDVDTLKANSAHSTLSSKNDYIKVTKNGVNYGVEFISGDLATKPWIDTNYQEKGNYLSANALDNLSGKWQSTYNTVKTYSGEWAFSADVDKRLEDTSAWANATFQPIGDYLSANALDKIKETSGKWDSTYSSVYDNSANWNEVSAKLDKKDFDNWSAVLDERIDNIEKDVDILKSSSADWNEVSAKLDVSSFSSVSSNFALKTEVQEEFEQTSAWVKDNFLSANALDNLSGNWESTYKTVETNSAKWETAYETLTSNSADWDEVSAKLNSATFATYSADIKSTIETFSGEFVELSGDFTAHSANSDLHLSAGEREKWNSAANRVENSAAIWDTVSAKVNNTEFEEFKTSAHNELEKKLDKNAFESWSANKDYDFYSAGNGIKIENHIVSVSADYALSADVDTRLEEYYNKTEVDEKFADFGGFVVVTTLPVSGDNKKIYLINDPSSPNPDQYKEYIYTENGWKCIGDTSVDLTQYYKKTETSGAEEISTEFTNTSAWANETFQPIGNYVTSGNYITAGPAWVLVNGTNGVQWSGLDVSELGKTYVVKSTNGSIDVGVTHDGNETTYDLSATAPEIEGENGVSAYYDEENDKYVVGLDEHYLSYAQATSTVTTLTTDPQTLGNFNNISVMGDKISLSQNTITLTKGLYHVDLQVNITIENEDAQYYDVTLSNSISNGALNKVIDGSFTHTETLDLSFDALVIEDSDSLEFTLAGLPTGNKYYIKNIQIHEMTTVDSILDATGGQYTGGVAISVSNNNKINVVYDSMSGIGVSPNNELYVKLGKGLSFSNEGGVDGSLSLDEVTEGVVETVQTLEQELNGKLTTNMNISDAKIVGNPFYNEPSTPTIGATLFTVPLTHKINTDTEISFFTSQAMNQSFPIMIGLLEYNFKYYFIPENTNTVSSRTQTTWIGDTGLIWSDTRAEDANYMSQNDNNANRKYTFKFKHVTDVITEEVTDQTTGEVYINSYGPEMRSDRAYYLVFFGRAGQGLSYFLADDGYAATTNSDPYLSFYVNNMKYYETPTSEGVSMANWDNATWSAHNDMTMNQINFWDREGEANTIKRPLVLIRNNA